METTNRASHRNSDFIRPRAAQNLKYEPLDSSKNEIRLLRIKPSSNPDETIRCQLFHTTLDDAPPYHALSYAWGWRVGSSPILINSGTVDVTPNLKNALQRLRPKDGEEDLVVWVDAICINQKYIPERNVQTGKMRMIYRNAERVLVWVGRGNPASEAALQLARDLNSGSDPGAILQDPSRRDDIEALVYIFRRKYWWRIWVVQEVSSAKDAIVYCGEDAIPWALLERVVDIMKQEEHHLWDIFYKHPSKIRTLTHGGPRGLQVSRYSYSTRAPPLLEILLSHKSKNSTDPRDKVYALVGISSSRESFGNIDYSLPMRDAYSYTARHIITSTQMLDVICVKQHDDDQFRLPSWVPNWTRPLKDYGHARIGLHHHEPPFCAAGDSLGSVSFTGNGYIMNAKGAIFDRIKAVGIPFKKHGPPSEISMELQAYNNSRQIFFGFRDKSIDSQVEFGKIISCGNWTFDNKIVYQEKLKAISDLSKRHLLQTSIEPTTQMEEADERKNPSVEPEAKRAQMNAILSASLTMNRRRLFISSDNVAGLAPWDAEVGDRICILFGCRFPVILRPSRDHYILIGEAYVHGFMNGEAIVNLNQGRLQEEVFQIH